MKILVTRLGAFGDSLVLSPVLKELKKQGHEVILHTGERGMTVFENCDYIDEIIPYKDNSLSLDEIHEFIDEKAKEVGADKHINFTGSIEHLLAKHPNDPEYNFPKYERAEVCDKNYYEEAFKWADIEGKDFNPCIVYTEDEIKEARSHIKKDKFNILWAMSGSGRHKAYPWVEYVIGEILNNYKDIHFITVGDLKCKIIESFDGSITNLSGDVSMRMSMCLTGQVDLVISPDTGVLHSSGQFTTPKIGLLGHTTIENITKHFKNDYSLEADCACAPCFRLIYDHSWQCPYDKITGGAWCMSHGITPERLADRIKEVIPSEYRA